ncbi:hypothetical protein Bcav_4142 [Beutenbergia cavernae DSM 12333]|uniref:DUF4440 domain-containing protein n=1 Tax=Beutenbergia cavernae (strain ATCC BAA-8 / DSM 12333 / CCUG 43141 / JCM 11478 / NBRC 16432 / NCIMB 13614 / HKI 0122) TaxID=471853 RepID=C5C624_BEUC1|nr:hypothetical protein [Beutenbergia cavernae]ACQ82382.1 hypothetical protein Bcav_4142 [Beutenbergia cavernae DSM 12333]
MTETTTARDFFDTYTRALLDRDATAIADLYAVPALIEFPGQAVAVSDRAQTEAFFAAAVGQYAGVNEARAEIDVIAETGHSRWVDVRWLHDGEPAERFVYQLVLTEGRWEIAVLTPMDT